MVQEKNLKAASGYFMLLIAFACLVGAVVSLLMENPFVGVPLMLLFVFIIRGLFIVNPNEAKVLTLFGKYVGTVKDNGMLWANPFYLRQNISLRARNMNGQSSNDAFAVSLTFQTVTAAISIGFPILSFTFKDCPFIFRARSEIFCRR